MCGHDHHLEYLHDLGNNLHYIISGAGSQVRTEILSPNTAWEDPRLLLAPVSLWVARGGGEQAH